MAAEGQLLFRNTNEGVVVKRGTGEIAHRREGVVDADCVFVVAAAELEAFGVAPGIVFVQDPQLVVTLHAQLTNAPTAASLLPAPIDRRYDFLFEGSRVTAETPVHIAPGTKVKLYGLESERGQALNGRRGVLERWDRHALRCRGGAGIFF